MLPYITAFIFFIALASVFVPEHFFIFSSCFLAILVVEIIVVRPTRNQMTVFFIVLGSFVIEFILLLIFRPIGSVLSYLLLQLFVPVFCYLGIVFKYQLFSWWIKERELNTSLAEGVLLKYLVKFVIPLEALAILEELIYIGTGINLNIIYANYSWIKVLIAAGLFVLLFELFKKKEQVKLL